MLEVAVQELPVNGHLESTFEVQTKKKHLTETNILGRFPFEKINNCLFFIEIQSWKNIFQN